MKYKMTLNSTAFNDTDENFKDIIRYLFQGESNTALVLSVLEDLDLHTGNEYEVEVNIRQPGENKTPKELAVQINISDELYKHLNKIGDVFKAITKKYPETREYINEQIEKHMKI
jgi:hypothetical protein